MPHRERPTATTSARSTVEALELCERNIGSYQPVHAPCSTPIDWSVHGGWENNPAEAVACCCTQELEP